MQKEERVEGEREEKERRRREREGTVCIESGDRTRVRSDGMYNTAKAVNRFLTYLTFSFV